MYAIELEDAIVEAGLDDHTAETLTSILLDDYMLTPAELQMLGKALLVFTSDGL